jgi:hypothetical protein
MSILASHATVLEVSRVCELDSGRSEGRCTYGRMFLKYVASKRMSGIAGSFTDELLRLCVFPCSFVGEYKES